MNYCQDTRSIRREKKTRSQISDWGLWILELRDFWQRILRGHRSAHLASVAPGALSVSFPHRTLGRLHIDSRLQNFNTSNLRHQNEWVRPYKMCRQAYEIGAKEACKDVTSPVTNNLRRQISSTVTCDTKYGNWYIQILPSIKVQIFYI